MEHFIVYKDALQIMKNKLGNKFQKNMFDKLIKKALIASFNYNDNIYFHVDDMVIFERLMLLNTDMSTNRTAFTGYDGDLFSETINLVKGTFMICSVNDTDKKVPAFVKNIIYFYGENFEESEECQYDLLGIHIFTNNKYVSSYISGVISRKNLLDMMKSSNFANSSAYMGSKKGLVGFIVESIWPHLNDNMSVLDIMCGSGAVSNAFAQIRKIYASDAQYFCRLLAKIQGKGFNINVAEKLQRSLFKNYSKNMRLLKSECNDALKKEEDIFHMDLKNRAKVASFYLDFIQSFELFSSDKKGCESLEHRIKERKQNHKKEPYCLFTYYFSNIYFGLEQCNQIDSIRYAIDMLEDFTEREWLLGILVTSVSSIASNYAGHFAQPKKINEASIYDIIEKRKRSVWLEFSKRMQAVAIESERSAYEIIDLKGPWENALQEVKNREKDILIYLDAPYKREEYSRYYHVLETLVQYDYPASEGKGRLRSIKKERFKSNFSSRNSMKVEEYFIYVITNILKEARGCAWSYSNNGLANIMHIINGVQKVISCKMYMYCKTHQHASQGKMQKRKKINVIEYCILFVRD
ncbi:MAG: DNA adenine methylase [Lachnoclostridium sp.]|nr:DNA adenine methylase [Lachnoclostridium sp.]